MAHEKLIELTAQTFEQEVLHSDIPVMVDFWAPWCGPCRMVSPVVDEIAQENPQIKVGKINVDEQSQLAAAFQIMSIPTLIALNQGKIIGTAVGVRPKADILKLVEG